MDLHHPRLLEGRCRLGLPLEPFFIRSSRLVLAQKASLEKLDRDDRFVIELGRLEYFSHAPIAKQVAEAISAAEDRTGFLYRDALVDQDVAVGRTNEAPGIEPSIAGQASSHGNEETIKDEGQMTNEEGQTVLEMKLTGGFRMA